MGFLLDKNTSRHIKFMVGIIQYLVGKYKMSKYVIKEDCIETRML